MAYLTEEERKKPLSHMCDHFVFTSCADLSIGVKIRPIIDNPKYKTAVNVVAKDVASFTAWWTINFHSSLNGFPGFGAIKWEME